MFVSSALLFFSLAAVRTSWAAALPQTMADTAYESSSSRKYSSMIRYADDKEAFQENFRGLLARALQSSVGLQAAVVATASENINSNNDDHHDHNQEISLRRYLADGDFAAFNNLFAGARIDLPDASVTEGKLKLTLKGPYCEDVQIGDILLSHNMESSQRFTFNVRVIGLDLKCYSKYDYDWRFLDGSGNIFANTRDSSADTTISFSSPNFTILPPSSSNVDSCVANVNISDLDFSGGFVNSLLDTFEKSFRGLIAGQVETVLCDELSSLGTTFVGDMLDWAGEELEIYRQPIPPNRANPLYPESVLNPPPEIKLLDYQNLEESLGSWVTDVLAQADSFFGDQVDDLNAPDGTGKDLGVNVFMRNTILDSDRALSVLISDLPFTAFDPVLFNSHDKIAETTITLVGLRLYGLDTFNKFDPLVAIGKYTLENAFHLDFVTVEMDLEVKIKPSTKDDAVISGANPGLELKESIKVKFGVDNLDVKLALLMAINEDRFKALEIGGILQSANLFACFASVLHKLGLSGFDVSVGSVRDPVLEGFVSRGIDRVVSEAVEAVFLMYEPTFLRALPAMFQGPFRDIIESEVLASDFFNPSDGACSWLMQASSFDEYIDFRDLFLEPVDAKELGGSGDEPYGNLGHVIYKIFQDRVINAPGEDSGYLAINDMLIKPWTKGQSGVEGLLRFDSDFLSISLDTSAGGEFASMISSVDFSMGNARVENLSTIISPIKLLTPNYEAHSLWNDMTASPRTQEGINFNVLVRLALGGGNSPWTMDDEIDLSVTLDALGIVGSLNALVETSKFLRLPLKHAFNLNCWLSMIPPPEVGEDAIVNEETVKLALSGVYTYLVGMDINAACLDCSPGLGLLPRMLEIFRTAGAVRHLGTRLSELGRTLVQGDTLQSLFNNMLTNAPYLCPVNPKFDPDAVSSEQGFFGISDLTATDLDTLLFGTVLLAEVGLVAISENHRVYPHVAADPLELQRSVTPENNYLDWTDFGNSLGLGSLGDQLLQTGLDYIHGYEEDGKLKINALVEDFLLKGSDVFEIKFDDSSLSLDQMVLNLKNIKVDGLNSFESLKLAVPIGSQTLSNDFSIRTISVKITATIDIPSTEDPAQEVTISFAVDNLALSIALFTAINVDELWNIELGSIVNTGDILDCVLSTVDKLNVPVVTVRSATIQKPQIRGLHSETSSVISDTLDAVYEEFQSNIEDALPILLDTSLRKIVNSIVDNLVDGAECQRDTVSGVVDYRAMFGGSSSVYGNIPQFAIELLESSFFSLDRSTGLAKLNKMVTSWTTNAFGKSGTFSMGDYFINTRARRFRNIGIDMLKFAFGRLSISNIDTVKAPVRLLEPDANDGSLLNNNIKLGGEPRPVRFGFEALLETSGDPALTSANNMELFINLVDVDMFASVLAKLGLEELMSLSLRRLVDLNCWLALFHTNEDAKQMLIHTLSIAISSFSMSVKCKDEATCSSGLPEANELLERITATEFGKNLGMLVLDVVEEIVEGEYFNSILDDFVGEAAEACPEVSSLSPNARHTSEKKSALPDFSSVAMQKIMALVTFVIEAGAVGIFETHSSFSTEWDPIVAQDELLLNETELIDFSNFSTSVGDWADTLVNEVRGYAEGGEDGSPRINEILRSFFLDESGSMAFNLTHVRTKGDDFGLQLVEIRVQHLDTFTNVTLLDMIGPQTIRNVVKMNSVRGELDLILRLGKQELPLTIHLELEDVDLAFTILLAINKGILGDIELGQLLFKDLIMRCLFSSMPEVFVTELDFSAVRVTSFGIDGLGEQSALVKSITSLVLESHGERIAHLMRPFFGTTIRAILNNWFEFMVSERYGDSCPNSTLNAEAGSSIDFRDLLLPVSDAVAYGGDGNMPYGDLFQWAIGIVKKELMDIDPSTGLSDANKAFIGPLTRAQSQETGRVSFPGDLFSTDTRVQVGGLDALINLRVYDAYVRNLDTVGAPLSVLEPVQGKAWELSNSATFGKQDIEPVQVGFQLFFSLSDANSQIRNDLAVSVDLESVYVLLDALMKFAEARFLTIPVRHLTDLNCWLYMMPAPRLDARGIREHGEALSLGLTKLDVSVDRVKLNVTCNDCSSPGMADFSKLLSTEEAANAATETSNMLLDYMTQLLGGDFLQTQFDMLLNDAARMCPSSHLYDPAYESPEYAPFESPEQVGSLRTLILIGISSGIVIFSVLAIMTCVKCVVRRRHRRWIRTLEARKVQALFQLQAREKTKEESLNYNSRSLFRSEHVPLFVRWFMPVVILGNIGFFMSGHLSLGATVNIEAHLAEQEFSVKNFFEFSMLRSTLEIWDAGGKELAVMIFIFSVLWPYIKQIMTMGVWFAPPSLLSISRRGSTLLWLDTLAKWSVVDIMTLIVTVAGFRISIQSPDVGFLPDEFYSLDLLVVPMWGLYANMIAQLISQLSSHAIVHYHRRIEEEATKEYENLYRLRSTATVILEEEIPGDSSTLSSVQEAADDSPLKSNRQIERLAKHAFSRPHRGESDKLITRRGSGGILVIFAAAVAFLVAVGCTFPSFSLEILGVMGVFIESGQEFNRARTDYSVFTIIGLLFEQARFTGRFADYLGLGSLAGLLVISVLIVPVVQSLVLLYLWFRPMGLKRRRRFALAVEVLQAWQYAEVYLMSVIVASWQLGPVSDFMINTYCENLKDTFAQMVYYGIIKEEDAQCFRVEARIENASYFLAGGSVALALLNTFVMRAVNQYFRDIDASDKEFKAAPGREGEEVEDLPEAIRHIQPVPVLFTDAFRWFLVREDADPSRRVFVAQDGQDLGINHITEDIPEHGKDGMMDGRDLMADTLEVHAIEPVEPVDPIDPTPVESFDHDDYDCYDDEFEYFEDSQITRFGQGPAPRPRQPEVLPADDNLSRDADQGTSSNSGGRSLDTPQAGGHTVLSCFSDLTQPYAEPWVDV